MHWLDTLIGGGAATAIYATVRGGVFRLVKRILRDVVTDVTKEVTSEIRSDVSTVKEKLASETGGNSNGLRQKVNEISEDIAKLTGAFEQHVKQVPGA